MREKISASILKFNLVFFFYNDVPALSLGLAITMLNLIPIVLRWILLFIYSFITICSLVNSLSKNWSSNKHIEYADYPIPSIQNIFQIGLRYVGLFVIICIATYIPMRFLLAAHILTMVSWMQGVSAYIIWEFCFELQNILTTQYCINKAGIYIKHGPSFIYLPIDNLKSVTIIKRTNIPFETRLKTRSLFILGIKSYNNFLAIKMKHNNQFVEALFPEIYLTPANPLDFLRFLQEMTRVIPN